MYRESAIQREPRYPEGKETSGHRIFQPGPFTGLNIEPEQEAARTKICTAALLWYAPLKDWDAVYLSPHLSTRCWVHAECIPKRLIHHLAVWPGNRTPIDRSASIRCALLQCKVSVLAINIAVRVFTGGSQERLAHASSKLFIASGTRR